jgi:hypothetical protein
MGNVGTQKNCWNAPTLVHLNKCGGDAKGHANRYGDIAVNKPRATWLCSTLQPFCCQENCPHHKSVPDWTDFLVMSCLDQYLVLYMNIRQRNIPKWPLTFVCKCRRHGERRIKNIDNLAKCGSSLTRRWAIDLVVADFMTSHDLCWLGKAGMNICFGLN